MVVNHSGDLKLHSMHDTPKQLTWSSQGDLLVGGGRAMRHRSGVQDEFDEDSTSSSSPSREKESSTPLPNLRVSPNSQGLTTVMKKGTAPHV